MKGREWIRLPCSAWASLFVVLVSGCGDETTAPSRAAIGVTVDPPSASTGAGLTLNFTATVTNDPSAQGVTWSVTGCTGGAVVCGSLTSVTSTTAIYTAPTPVLSDAHLDITATSVADHSKSSTATVTIGAIGVSVSPTSAIVRVNGSQTFTATVSNDPSYSQVSWTVTGCSGGVAVCGSLTEVTSTTATYTAPTTVPPGGLGVTATSVADNTKSFTASVAVITPGAAGRIAFTSDRSGCAEIWAMNADGSGVVELINSNDHYCGANANGAAWSPDGTKIAFYYSPNVYWAIEDIVVMNADGSQPHRLIPPADTNFVGRTDPAWSPDGTRIAAVGVFLGRYEPRCGCRVTVSRLVVMNADGRGLVALPVNGQEPAWSPDGRIAFVGSGEIFVMNPDGTGLKNLTNNPAAYGGPAWSPDGTRIAFRSTRTGVSDLYVMNADGSGVTALTADSATEGRPAWSPDGTKITFASTRDGNWEIYTMYADGSGVVRLTDNPALDARPAWSP